MAATFNLQVITPERYLLDEDVESLVVPAVGGYLGVLANHAPLIAGLEPGLVKYRQGGDNKYFVISGGFIEVSCNNATVLANTAEKPGEIDKTRAEAAKERAVKRLSLREPGTDIARAELALKKAVARLKVT